MLLPVPQPDELFASVLARLGRLNGIDDLREVAESCFGLRQCPSFIDAKLNLPDFCQRFGNAYGDPESLLERLTALSARQSLGEIDDGAWRSLVRGVESVSLGELTFCGAVELRFCPSCRKSDIEERGVTYWHRTHQLPILHRCVIHGDRLKRAVVKRAALHQSFPLPGDFSDDRTTELPVVWNDHFEKELAVFSEALLSEEQPPKGLVRQVLLDGLREQKFMGGNGSLRTRELLLFLTVRVGRNDGSDPSDESAIILRRVVRSIREPARGFAFGRALLLCVLLGNWRVVTLYCQWHETLGGGNDFRVHEVCKRERDAIDLQKAHREKCIAYMFDNPAASRLGFIKKNYRSFRWLLRNDRSWLDGLLPIAEGGMEQLALF